MGRSGPLSLPDLAKPPYRDPALASDHRADILGGLPGRPHGDAGAFSRSIIIAGGCPREAIRVVNNLLLCGAD